MPALGMAQDTGVLVSWHKAVGDHVEAGDVLMEVETDKAVVEVEAQASGFLTELRAKAGASVPVGDVVAVIDDTSDADAKKPAKQEAPVGEREAPPSTQGTEVVMPALGMAQDTGRLVTWRKEPGDAVRADEILLEVETDKSIMEVEAGHDGFVAELRAEGGDEVPVGEVIAIISAERPDAPARHSHRSEPKTPPPPESRKQGEQRDETPEAVPPSHAVTNTPPASAGRILASPKAKRLAMEQGLDLSRLIAEGVDQPFHVADVEILRTLPLPSAAAHGATASSIWLSASVPACEFDCFRAWLAGETAEPVTAATILASLVTGALRSAREDASVELAVAVENPASGRTFYRDADIAGLAGTNPSEKDDPILLVRDLTTTRLTGMRLGGETVPVVTIMRNGEDLSITLEARPDALSVETAVALASEFAARLETPLRQLL